MKDEKLVSANDINRFMYCPYQWYYKKYYGAAELQKKYQALKNPKSNHPNHLTRGNKHHKNYYIRYRLARFLKGIGLLLLLILLFVWGWLKWQTA
jgi:hypothetical protein